MEFKISDLKLGRDFVNLRKKFFLSPSIQTLTEYITFLKERKVQAKLGFDKSADFKDPIQKFGALWVP